LIRIYTEEGVVVKEFSKKFEADGMIFEEPTDMMFSFNNPLGACPTCEGFGKVLGIDENLVVPDKSLSVYQGAVVCWKGEVMGEWLKDFIVKSEKYNFPIHRPYYDLTQKEKDLLWHGARGLHGIDDFFKFVEENLYKIQYRVMQARYRGKTTCPVCKGSRLRPEALYVQVGGKNIAELVTMPVSEAKAFFDQLELDETDAAIAKRLLTEINNRLQFLLDVGLGYLALDRLSASLSGGESQRINLATSLGSSLVGSLYILDEPSIGLHQRDNVRLINSLKQLRDTGNSVIVVEHDKDMMLSADYVVDMGPKAGRLGGEVVFEGTPKEMLRVDTLTSSYLNGNTEIAVPAERRKGNGQFITIKGASGNNLKHVDVSFPLGTLICVTGVSGSGKSTLINRTLQPILSQHFYRSLEDPLAYDAIEGIEHVDKIVNVDQSPIGRSPRSNPATYTGVFS
ncbi:excinuclease ABC subunit A, partial [Paeniclostridium sordellii]|nr:excinuclease ABC subunit A [Paeniclostridium sordellii]